MYTNVHATVGDDFELNRGIGFCVFGRYIWFENYSISGSFRSIYKLTCDDSCCFVRRIFAFLPYTNTHKHLNVPFDWFMHSLTDNQHFFSLFWLYFFFSALIFFWVQRLLSNFSVRQRRMCTSRPDGVIHTNGNACLCITLSNRKPKKKTKTRFIKSQQCNGKSVDFDVKCETDFNYYTVWPLTYNLISDRYIIK